MEVMIKSASAVEVTAWRFGKLEMILSPSCTASVGKVESVFKGLGKGLTRGSVLSRSKESSLSLMWHCSWLAGNTPWI